MSFDEQKFKDESDEEDEISEPSSFCPMSLGLLRVGTELPPKPVPTQPIQKLNARGMPARIRKKNKLFFDDDIVNDKPLKVASPKKVIKQSPTLTKTPTKILKKRRGVVSRYMKMKDENHDQDGPHQLDDDDEDMEEDEDEKEAEQTVAVEPTVTDKKDTQKIGLSLRNLLKLPKAHKFVSHEWFYSPIDRSLLFEKPNDFENCLASHFPKLKVQYMTRTEWNQVRRIIGKPRRFSAAFFHEERRALEQNRQKIRILQTRKSADASFGKGLPTKIPMPLPVGSKITARLRKPQEGLFTGVVSSFVQKSSEYNITFDRSGLGTHPIPDFEVYTMDPTIIPTVPLDSITKDFRPKPNVPFYMVSPVKKTGPHASINKNDPLLGGDSYPVMGKPRMTLPKTQIGGYPIKLMELIIRTKKTLSAKQIKMNRLKGMNTEAEIYRSYRDPLPEDYQKRYGSLIIGLDKLNRDMLEYFNSLHVVSKDVLQQPPHVAAMLSPTYLREKCRMLGLDTFTKNNQGVVTDENMQTLITNLAMIMYIASNLNYDGDFNHVMNVLNGCMEETKTKIDFESVALFHKCVYTHIRHIQYDLAKQQK